MGNLYLDGNHITSLPESLGNLTSLGELNLYNNALVVLPESFGNLTSLAYLYLNSNALASLPESLTQLSNLNYININNNAICPYALSGNLRDFLDQYNEQDKGDWRNVQDKGACDSDNDGVMDPGDNCPLVANTDQADRNKIE
ncbi:MAG: hypothetical protein WCJ45_01145 [bacterium]